MAITRNTKKCSRTRCNNQTYAVCTKCKKDFCGVHMSNNSNFKCTTCNGGKK
jgi:hypothetical protein